MFFYLSLIVQLNFRVVTVRQRLLIRELITKLKGYPQAKSIETDLTYLDNYVERLINSKDIKNTDKNAGEKFSIKKTKNIAYSEQLSLIENKKFNGSNSLYVGMPSNELQSIGISNNPFAMNQSDFRKSRRDSGNNQHYSSHGIPIDFFEKLPTKINSAPLVIDNGNKATIITDYQMNDKKGQKSYVIVGIIKNQVMENDTVNLIKSIYPLDDFINLIMKYSSNQQLVVLNKNKAEKLLTTIGIQPSEVSRILNLANDSIHQTEPKSQ